MKYLYDEFSMLNYGRFNSKILKGEVDKDIIKKVKKEKDWKVSLGKR